MTVSNGELGAATRASDRNPSLALSVLIYSSMTLLILHQLRVLRCKPITQSRVNKQEQGEAEHFHRGFLSELKRMVCEDMCEADAEEQTRRVQPDLTGEENTEQKTRAQEARNTRSEQ